jgi:hypothetical protein
MHWSELRAKKMNGFIRSDRRKTPVGFATPDLVRHGVKFQSPGRQFVKASKKVLDNFLPVSQFFFLSVFFSQNGPLTKNIWLQLI